MATTCCRKVKHRITAPLRVPWLVVPLFDGVNEKAEVRANVAVADGHADTRASTVMTDDNDDNADDGNFDNTLSEILGALSRVSTSLDLDLAFGTVDSNVDPACIQLLSPLSPLPPSLASSPLSLGSPSEMQEFLLS